MQIVINIPEEMVMALKQGSFGAKYNMYDLVGCVMNGTPLPKGHGRLIDADLIAKQYGLDDATKYGNKNAKQQDFSYSTMMMYEIADMIDDAPTIIEADGEYEAKVITRGKCMMCGKELTEGLFFCKECGDKANSGK